MGRNMIDWVKEDPASTIYSSWNHSKINTQGVEMGVEFRLGNLLPVLGDQSVLAIDYTRMHQDSDTRNMISLYSLNYLRDKFTTRFHHCIYKDLSASWYFRFQKRMGTYEKYEDKVKVGDVGFPSFSTLDLKLNYKYNDMSFYLNLHNLYDTHYFDKGNIPPPGFWLMGGISYTFRYRAIGAKPEG